MRIKIISKAFACIMLIAITCACVNACGNKGYKNDVAVATLSLAADADIAMKSNLADASSDFMEFFLNVDPSLYSEYSVKTPIGSASIDEYGIFKANSPEDAEKIAASLDSYLASRVATWDTRYSQEEKPKVDGACTKVFGNYVAYAILSDTERAEFFNNIEDTLS